MAFLPIIERELRVAARRPSTYWTRFGFATVAAGAGALMLLGPSNVGPFSTANGIIRGLSFLAFVYLLFRGIKQTADSLSREKREGTIGLLFLTDLRARGIVLGKFFSGALPALSALLVLFPVLAIGMLMGGMSGFQFFHLVVGLLTTLLLSLSIGMTISAHATEQKRAESSAALVVVFIWFGIPLIDQAILRLVPAWPAWLAIRSLSPVYLHPLALGSPAAGSEARFWSTVLANHLEAAFFLGWAIWKLKRSWQDQPAAIDGRSWRERRNAWRNRWTFGSAKVRVQWRRRLLDKNPFLWLAARDRWNRWRPWILLVGLTVLALALALISVRNLSYSTRGLFFVLGSWYLALQLILAGEAGLTLHLQRSTGALEFLLSTPLSPQEIVRGQWLALRILFAGPVVAFLILVVTTLLVLWLGPPQGIPNLKTNATWMILAGTVRLGFDLAAAGWVSLWMGLKRRKRDEVAGSTIGAVIVGSNLPWLCLVFLSVPSSLRASFNASHSSLLLWLVTGILTDLALIAWARHRLFQKFRKLASLDYLIGSWGGWGRWLGERYARWRRAADIAQNRRRPADHAEHAE